MKNYRFTILFVLLLAIVSLVLFFRQSSSTLNKSDSEFAVADTAGITRLFIADKLNNEVLLQQIEPGKWIIDGKFPAHKAKVDSFLETLLKLKVKAPVPLVGHNNVMTRMGTVAKKMEIYQWGYRIDFLGLKLFPVEKKVKTYYVGDVTQDNMGTYMLMEGSSVPYIVFLPNFRGFVASRYTTNAEEWRDHTIFKSHLKDIKSVDIEYPQVPDESFRAEITPDRQILLYHNDILVQAYDTARVLSFITSFNDVRFESFLNYSFDREFIDSVRATVPTSRIKLVRNDGREVSMTTFFKPGSNYSFEDDIATLEPYDLDRAYAFINNDEDFVLIQYYIFDRILRKLSYLRGIDNDPAAE